MFSLISSLRHPAVLALVAAIGFAPVSTASAQDVDAIMRDAHKILDHFPSLVAEVDMLIEAKGKERQRALRLLTKQQGDRKQIIATFRAPEAIKGAGYASDMNMVTGTQKSFVYFPSVGKPRAIKAKGQNDSFFGSDFSYSDIAGRRVGQDSYELAGESDAYFIIAATPKDKADPYSKLLYQIAKSNKTVRSILFFDKNGRELKRLSNLGFQEFEGVPVIALSLMENLQTGGKTTLDRGDVQVDVILLDDDFGPAALVN